MTVPTGAFVARRNGKVFVTGNSGMPKSVNISKVIDKAAGAVREKVPATGGLHNYANMNHDGWSKIGADAPVMDSHVAVTDEAKQWDGWGTGLSPGLEPIVLARKPLIGTIPVNVLEHGTGGINIDACRVPRSDGYVDNCVVQGADRTPSSFSRREVPSQFSPSKLGGWPANVAHDGSQMVLDLFPETAARRRPCSLGGHDGSAARYFYCAKPSAAERDAGLGGERHTGGERAGGRAEGSEGLANPRAGTRADGFNDHATVKPIALMRWMVRLVTPPGGTVLDPFMGSGTTGIAAHLEGFDFIGCELDQHHAATAELRIRHYSGGDGIVSEAPRGEVESRQPDRTGFFN